MSSFKEIAKGGWKPKGTDGKWKEKLREDFKGIDQVAGWMGKGKESSTSDNRVACPLYSLKDPSRFEPPPKRIDYHYEKRGPALLMESEEREAEVTRRTKPPPTPYRADSLSISTDEPNWKAQESKSFMKEKPNPPKLPPRAKSNAALCSTGEPEPDPQERLSKNSPSSGLDFSQSGIRGSFNKVANMLRQPPPTPLALSSSPSTPASTTTVSKSHKDQNCSSNIKPLLSLKSNSTTPGTTFAQKQAALKTVASLRNDPSSVSFRDARMAASTANNFRERHGNQVKSGLQLAQTLNQKYAISDKVGARHFALGAEDHPPVNDQSAIQNKDHLIKKKPPPPPVKRSDLAGSNKVLKNQPPPIPMSTKPRSLNT